MTVELGVQWMHVRPLFGGERTKIHQEFCLIAWLLSVVHPLMLAVFHDPLMAFMKYIKPMLTVSLQQLLKLKTIDHKKHCL